MAHFVNYWLLNRAWLKCTHCILLEEHLKHFEEVSITIHSNSINVIIWFRCTWNAALYRPTNEYCKIQSALTNITKQWNTRTSPKSMQHNNGSVALIVVVDGLLTVWKLFDLVCCFGTENRCIPIHLKQVGARGFASFPYIRKPTLTAKIYKRYKTRNKHTYTGRIYPAHKIMQKHTF